MTLFDQKIIECNITQDQLVEKLQVCGPSGLRGLRAQRHVAGVSNTGHEHVMDPLLLMASIV